MRKLLAVILLATPLVADVILEPPARRPPIHLLRMIVTTGADDLRHGSTVEAFLILKDGRRVGSTALNCRKNVCDGLPAHSERVLVWMLHPKSNIQPEEILRFGLAFKSAGDSWDLDALDVSYVVGAGSHPLLNLHKSGGVYRFTKSGSREWDAVVR